MGRAVSAALHTPQLGGHAVTRGPKFQSRHHLAPQRKLRSPKLKYEALEISEVRGPFTVILGPFESKLFSHYNCCWVPLWKQSSLLIHCSCYWAPFESKVGYFAHYSCKGGARGKCLACHHLNTPLYISLTMILYENIKPIEHVLLHPICVLSHLT